MSKFRVLLVLSCCLITACDVQTVGPDSVHEPLIYGADDRLEYYQAAPVYRSWADSTTVQLSSWQLSNNGSGYTVQSSSTFGSSNGLCSNEPFRSQPDPGSCSGFMVGDDLIATAGHCVNSSNCGSTRFVFGFRLDSAGSVRSNVAYNDVYSCAEIVARNQTSTDDWAVVRVDRPITGHNPLPIRRSGSVSLGDPLVLIGHPSGIPSKIAGGATVRSNGHSYYFEANTDSYGGNSGSAVFASDGTVEGILVRGNNDFVWTGSCYRSATCADSGCPGWEGITRISRILPYVPDIGAPPPPPSCSDDGYEDNDTSGTASVVGEGTIGNLEICTGDDDWFAVNLAPDDELDVSISFSHAEGDLDLRLYDPGLNQVAVSESTSNAESVSHTAVSGGLHYVRVYGYNGAAAGYSLTVDVTGAAPPPPPPGCVDDGFEPNDTSADAPLVSSGITRDLQACSGDDDWFALDLLADDELNVSILFSHAEGDLDLKLYDAGVNQVGVSESTTDNESIAFTAASAGRYYLRAYGYNGAEAGYDLDIDIVSAAPPPGCVDDSYEPNDSSGAAAALREGSYPGLQICSGDDDWYAVTLASGDELDVSISFSHAAGDLDLKLYDSAVNQQAVSESTSNSETVSHTASNAGTYYIRVYGYQGAEAGYSLTIGITEAAGSGGGTCDFTGTLSSTNTSDTYTYNSGVAAGTFLDADVSWTQSSSDLDLYLQRYTWWGSWSTVARSETSTSSDPYESITYTVPSSSGGDQFRWVLVRRSGTADYCFNVY